MWVETRLHGIIFTLIFHSYFMFDTSVLFLFTSVLLSLQRLPPLLLLLLNINSSQTRYIMSYHEFIHLESQFDGIKFRTQMVPDSPSVYKTDIFPGSVSCMIKLTSLLIYCITYLSKSSHRIYILCVTL